jgi:poly(A) polymerase
MELVDWWLAFAHAGHDEREQLITQAPATGGANGPAKKRKRRRKPANAAAQPVQADTA